MKLEKKHYAGGAIVLVVIASILIWYGYKNWGWFGGPKTERSQYHGGGRSFGGGRAVIGGGYPQVASVVVPCASGRYDVYGNCTELTTVSTGIVPERVPSVMI